MRVAEVPVGAPAVGQVVCGRYRLDEAIGEGAAAIVFRATDQILDIPVAVKVLMFDALGGALGHKAELTLRNEAVAAMALGHPHVARVFNYESDGAHEMLIMEYVSGGDSRDRRRRYANRRMPIAEVMHIGLQCLEGLAHAHRLGLLHHDVKPSNILLTPDGVAKLCDFGLARFTSAQWRAGVVAGTPGYMSPERFGGTAGDHRSDLYCLAATLYALANRRAPFGKKPAEQRAIGPPAQGLLPDSIYAELCRGLSNEPMDRHSDATEMRRALAAACDADGVVPCWRRTAPESVRPRASTPPPIPPAAFDGVEMLDDAAIEEVESFDEWGLDAYPELDLAAAFEALDGLEAAVPTPVISPPDMVHVAAWRFESAYTQAPVRVAAFFMDVSPVRNVDYLAFVEATRHVPPSCWHGWQPPTGRALHPVVNLSLDEALAYAAWAGKRLPSALEWEAACRSPDGRSFPWGEVMEPSYCHGPGAGHTGTVPVDMYSAGRTACGCLGMVGNVWEWTAPTGDDAQGSHVAHVFGGSYRHHCDVFDAVARTTVSVNNSYDYLGFRCAMTAPG